MNITLTLNKETREVQAESYGNDLIVHGIEMTTTTGAKSHIGWAILMTNESGVYTQRDIRELRYHGMRGNGYAQNSRMRYVGFKKSEAA